MKKILFIICLYPLGFLISCSNKNPNDSKKLPRVAICGLAIESSTFSPAQSGVEAFRTRRGQEVFTYYPFLADTAADRKRANWFPALRGHAIPGGIVTREAYEMLVTETLDSLKKTCHTMDFFSIYTER